MNRPWKKQKNIDGVSSGSILELKSVLHQTEQEIKRSNAIGEKRPKVVLSKKSQELYTTQNKGVKERAQRDESARYEDEKSIEKAEQKLREKSLLYNRMGVYDPAGVDDDEKAYLVDFERKNWDLDTNPSTSSLYSADMGMENERRSWEKKADEELDAEEDKQARIRITNQLELETKAGRRKHLEMKEKRKKEMAARLKKIAAKEQMRKAQLQGIPLDELQKTEEEETEELEREREEVSEQQVDAFLEMMKKGFS